MATDADAAVWGDLLIQSKHVGAVREGGPANGQSHTVAPGSGQAVEKMDEQLVAGVFSDGESADTVRNFCVSDFSSHPKPPRFAHFCLCFEQGYLMVVDLRTSMSVGAVKPRSVTLYVHQQSAVTCGPWVDFDRLLVTTGRLPRFARPRLCRVVLEATRRSTHIRPRL